ncbi:hypothetical protein TRP8649_01250 [Pelagimonas phthalicica]|uniref:Uncharacterized protein n=1 Tax=Pelagimonas phthalicica TaxID=1037362 RepID=A0A238J908_9RHOB|nr:MULTISPECIES: hypothetical protein [Roseobacteraceae]TDS94325.1 hypothetical protein CLV87_0822 [Pelagimonas phthalicica]SMX27148.1 hypothetical protein TRP8649_01250 [Pelagimonas phthalicica]
MGQDWILDVLADLKTFARENGMPSLAAQLDDASFVAQAEIASLAEENGVGIFGRGAATGPSDRTVGVQ